VLALPALARDRSVLATVVIEPFEGGFPPVPNEPPEGFDAQVAFDVERARRGLWPAIHPARTTSRWYPSTRHEQLAHAARAHLARTSLPTEGGDVDPLVRALLQPFAIAEPFTSRPGERTPYDEMLDTVAARLDRV
jgi:F0F1-type ATP synthase beta subunit